MNSQKKKRFRILLLSLFGALNIEGMREEKQVPQEYIQQLERHNEYLKSQNEYLEHYNEYLTQTLEEEVNKPPKVFYTGQEVYVPVQLGYRVPQSWFTVPGRIFPRNEVPEEFKQYIYFPLPQETNMEQPAKIIYLDKVKTVEVERIVYVERIVEIPAEIEKIEETDDKAEIKAERKNRKQEAKAQKNTLKEKYEALTKENKELEEALAIREEQNQELQRKIAQAQESAAKREREYEEIYQKLEAENTKLEKQNQELQKVAEQAEESAAKRERDYAELHKRLEVQEAENAKLKELMRINKEIPQIIIQEVKKESMPEEAQKKQKYTIARQEPHTDDLNEKKPIPDVEEVPAKNPKKKKKKKPIDNAEKTEECEITIKEQKEEEELNKNLLSQIKNMYSPLEICAIDRLEEDIYTKHESYQQCEKDGERLTQDNIDLERKTQNTITYSNKQNKQRHKEEVEKPMYRDQVGDEKRGKETAELQQLVLSIKIQSIKDLQEILARYDEKRNSIKENNQEETKQEIHKLHLLALSIKKTYITKLEEIADQVNGLYEKSLKEYYEIQTKNEELKYLESALQNRAILYIDQSKNNNRKR